MLRPERQLEKLVAYLARSSFVFPMTTRLGLARDFGDYLVFDYFFLEIYA